ncbi:MAG: (Fe-S)-binding protein, partial [Solirubrobacterales bacterium]
PLARRTRRGRGLPPPAPPRPPATSHFAAAALYIPSCTNRIFGTNSPKTGGPAAISPGRREALGGIAAALVEVSDRAGLPVWIPADLAGSCCGLPWSSKGYPTAHREKANEMVARLWRWSGEGELAVIVDAASCTHALADPGEGVLSEENAERLGSIEVLDSVAWAHDHLLGRLKIDRRVGSLAVHPPCATRRMGLSAQLELIAGALAEEVYLPPSATCCGFAGDRGITHPELTAAATREQANELAGRSFDAYISANRTCEIGLSRATGAEYRSFLLLLEELTRGG